MQTVEQKNDVLVALAAAKRQWPQQRTAQLIVNAVGANSDGAQNLNELFHMEDRDLARALFAYSKR